MVRRRDRKSNAAQPEKSKKRRPTWLARVMITVDLTVPVIIVVFAVAHAADLL
jgi:hypothetical protein